MGLGRELVIVGQLSHLPGRRLDEPLLPEAERRAPEAGQRLDVLAPLLVVHVDAAPAGDDERPLRLVLSEIGERVELIGDVAVAVDVGVMALVSFPRGGLRRVVTCDGASGPRSVSSGAQSPNWMGTNSGRAWILDVAPCDNPPSTSGAPRRMSRPAGSESTYAWTRLFAALALSAIGGVGMWSVIVAMPAVQAEFNVARSAASLPYTMTMICFGFGGILMGRLSDRFGIAVPLVAGTVSLGLGYVVASQAGSLWQFALAQGLLVGAAGSVAFAPLIADTSLWFSRRRGMAVAVIASGSYLAGTVWPPVIQYFIEGGGLAPHLRRHRRVLRGDDAAAGAGPAAAVAADRERVAGLWRGRRYRGRSACRPPRSRRSWSSPGSAAASRCRCPRSTSWRTRAISATARLRVRACCR